MRRIHSSALSVLAALALWACGPGHLRPPDDGPDSASELLARVSAARQGLTSLSAEARVEYYGEQGVRKGDMLVIARRPDDLRFEALSPTGDTLALLVTDGRQFTSFQRGESTCYTGPACPRNISRLLPLGLSPGAVVQILLGEAPLLADAQQALSFDAEEGHYVLDLTDARAGLRQRVRYDPEHLSVLRVVLWRGERLVFRVDFGSFARLGDVRLPRRLAFRMPEGDVDLSLAYRDWARDPEDLGDESFLFTCPEGTRPVSLPCDDPPRPPNEGAPDD